MVGRRDRVPRARHRRRGGRQPARPPTGTPGEAGRRCPLRDRRGHPLAPTDQGHGGGGPPPARRALGHPDRRHRLHDAARRRDRGPHAADHRQPGGVERPARARLPRRPAGAVERCRARRGQWLGAAQAGLRAQGPHGSGGRLRRALGRHAHRGVHLTGRRADGHSRANQRPPAAQNERRASTS